MDFKIGDADELADIAEKMIKGRTTPSSSVDSEKLFDMQLGDLRSEATQNWAGSQKTTQW